MSNLKFFLRWVLVGVVLWVPHAALAEVKACGAGALVLVQVEVPDAEVLDRQVHASGQNRLRGLIEYIELAKIGVFLRNGRMNPNFHWVDVGGGAGIAALQSFIFADEQDARQHMHRVPWPITGRHRATVISFEDIFSQTLLNDSHGLPNQLAVTHGMIEQARRNLEANGQYRYLTGRFFENIPEIEIGRADLITDVFGAFSYSANKFEVLLRIARLLKPGGRASIYTIRPMIETVDFRGHLIAESLPTYLSRHPIPGVIMVGQWLSLRLEAGTVEGLEALTKNLRYHHAERTSLPYRFYYRSVVQ